MIRTLFPQFTMEIAAKIKKEYLIILMFVYRNKIDTQKKKYAIFITEVEKILRIEPLEKDANN